MILFDSERHCDFVGRYDLNVPELTCETCHASWTPGVGDLIKSSYWPATLNFSTIYDTDIFRSFQELKVETS